LKTAPAHLLFALALGACATSAGPQFASEHSTGVGHFARPPGMPIGTGANAGYLDEADDPLSPDDPGRPSANANLAIPKFDALATARTPVSIPCAGCVELNVDVSDINQRDEFAIDLDGARIRRAVWTLLVNFNSDQLAVQPFVDGKYGKYTSLHVNLFPLGKPIEVAQDFDGKAHTVGLSVGSSGAWTGNQTMSVFVDSLRIEGSHPFTKSFDDGPEGLEPRTHLRNPKVVFHPGAAAPRDAG
jgi:hypothetical protein